MKNQPTVFDCITAGSFSGCCATIVCHPLDVIRTKIQTNTWNSKEFLKRGKPISNLYSGITFPFFAQLLYKSTIFTVNEFTNRLLFQRKSSSISLFTSGTVAGAINAIIVAPVELTRTNYITNKENIHLFQEMVKRSPLSLWRTLPATMLRDGPGLGLYFLAFEKTKSTLLDFNDGKINLWIRMLSGSMAGVAFWAYGLPIDTIKTTFEVQLRCSKSAAAAPSLWVTARTLFSEGGWARLYRPWPIALARGIPSAGVTLTAYDWAMDILLK